jgi:hypothetical protein
MLYLSHRTRQRAMQTTRASLKKPDIFSFHPIPHPVQLSSRKTFNSADCWCSNTNNPLTKTNLITKELIMAKPDDTRIAPASNNGHFATTPNRRIAAAAAATPAPAVSPTNAALIRVLEAVIGKLQTSPAAPLPSKSARPARIKPRRRVTVGASDSPALDANIPRIKLCGNWLARAGFGLRTRVRVHVANGCLILIPGDEG